VRQRLVAVERLVQHHLLPVGEHERRGPFRVSVPQAIDAEQFPDFAPAAGVNSRPIAPRQPVGGRLGLARRVANRKCERNGQQGHDGDRREGDPVTAPAVGHEQSHEEGDGPDAKDDNGKRLDTRIAPDDVVRGPPVGHRLVLGHWYVR
jgi:hypothetical protein